jgi:hypothetical protein
MVLWNYVVAEVPDDIAHSARRGMFGGRLPELNQVIVKVSEGHDDKKKILGYIPRWSLLVSWATETLTWYLQNFLTL